MKGPSLQKTTALSAALHLTVFLLTLIILHQSNNIVIPSPYIVSLVSSPDNRQETSAAEISRPSAEMKSTSLLDEKESSKVEKLKKVEQKRVDDTIKKMKAIEKVKRNMKLRDIVTLKSSMEQNIRKPTNQSSGSGVSQRTMFDSYYGKITDEIRREWVYPDIGEKNLQAVIFVRIMRDGKIMVQGVEKSSGNPLFDRSAQRAIAKATPVTPPPYEMEIGIRFYP